MQFVSTGLPAREGEYQSTGKGREGKGMEGVPTLHSSVVMRGGLLSRGYEGGTSLPDMVCMWLEKFSIRLLEK